ncbi:hypothetical protein FISHEDRAFT_20919, partial [Fistulina hepatica ATCC 64428]
MSWRTLFTTYVKKGAALPSSILFSQSSDTLTIFDGYEKSIFHLLILPRPKPPLRLKDYTTLSTLISADKARAKDVVVSLKKASVVAVEEIEKEMRKRYGFVWPVWCGFHSAPSIDHLHLHVISADLCSDRMKNKKHYNSFHPKLGFFLDIDDVLSWFDAEPSYFESVSNIDVVRAEKLLKGPLECFYCNVEFKNIPILKAHLQEEWNSMATRERGRLAR